VLAIKTAQLSNKLPVEEGKIYKYAMNNNTNKSILPATIPKNKIKRECFRVTFYPMTDMLVNTFSTPLNRSKLKNSGHHT